MRRRDALGARGGPRDGTSTRTLCTVLPLVVLRLAVLHLVMLLLRLLRFSLLRSSILRLPLLRSSVLHLALALAAGRKLVENLIERLHHLEERALLGIFGPGLGQPSREACADLPTGGIGPHRPAFQTFLSRKSIATRHTGFPRSPPQRPLKDTD